MKQRRIRPSILPIGITLMLFSFIAAGLYVLSLKEPERKSKVELLFGVTIGPEDPWCMLRGTVLNEAQEEYVFRGDRLHPATDAEINKHFSRTSDGHLQKK